ncbi:replicative DNA helicase [Pseudomonas sp. EpS/L25]|uniref:replicative DNA helicase n=1 Tax=Pseudomonas sp. EpS/L25 TaxID=1749078 RepID=UPI0007439E95|nr:replicative DNA helicase [Pseudomonas sp. EpS/L25]KUM43699.1 replicative DNA helicase [Pseudomonas sp. EpS/L25]
MNQALVLPDIERVAGGLVPAHSQEAEQAVLGGLMLDNSTWDMIADVLQEEDFFFRPHQLIFRRIALLAGQSSPFDVVTLAEVLPEVEEVGGIAYLATLAKDTPSVANIVAYAEIVAERAHLRRLTLFGFGCSREASTPGAKAAEVQEQVEQQLFALSQDRKGAEFCNVPAALDKLIDTIDERFNNPTLVTGVPTGLTDLDTLTSGWQDTDLIIVGARPGMGKTSFLLNCIDAALQRDLQKSVQVFSLEMPAEQLLLRQLAILGKLDAQKLKLGRLEDEDWTKLTYAVDRINKYGDRLVIDDQAAVTPTQLRARSRRAAKRFGHPAAIFVDYLQMMQCSGKENRANEISAITSSLKGLAKEMRCPVIALSQLNRELEKRANKRPINADLRDGGSIEQDADVILFLYREEYYHPETEHKGTAELILGKHRSGPLGTVYAAFIAQQTRFENLNAQVWREMQS